MIVENKISNNFKNNSNLLIVKVQRKLQTILQLNKTNQKNQNKNKKINYEKQVK